MKSRIRWWLARLFAPRPIVRDQVDYSHDGIFVVWRGKATDYVTDGVFTDAGYASWYDW